MVLLPTEMAENKPTIRVDCESTAPTTPGGFGQVLDAPEPEEDDSDTVAEQAREWKIAVEQSENVANLAGKLPAGVTRSLEQSEAAWTGASCCAGPGQRPFRLTIAGRRPIVGTYGRGSTFLLSDLKAPEQYFLKLRPILERKRDWRVLRQMSLCLLSFGKLLMYLDLDSQR